MARVQNDVLTEAFVGRLEDGGHRVTETRRGIANVVFRQQDHFTVEEILRELPGVGRATIFRNIKLMVDMKLLCRVVMEDSHVRYQVAEPRHHHHLICNECGRTTVLLGCDIEDVLRTKAEAQGLTMQSHRIEVFGLCRECQAA